MEIVRKIEVKIRYVFWALKRVRRIHLGDMVEYNGFLCSVINGVAAPRWKLLPLNKENLDLEKRFVYEYAHQDEFILKLKLKDYWRRFKQDYEFQISYWYSIDYRNPLFTKMQYRGN